MSRVAKGSHNDPLLRLRRPRLAGKTLKDMGYADVRNMGGFKAWVEACGEEEK